MRLYLSSYRIGAEPQRLLWPHAHNNRCGVIQNSLDCYTDQERRSVALEREFTELGSIGLAPEAIDLRQYFGKPDALRDKVRDLSYLWVVGGNSFILRKAFKLSGLDKIVMQLNDDDNFIYAGYSAGTTVLSPTMLGIDLCDQPAAKAEGYPDEIIWEGLGIIPFSMAPHYKSDHHETEFIDRSIEYFIANKLPFVALHDGEALVLDSKRIVVAMRNGFEGFIAGRRTI